ncbi:fimbrial protein [Achromobacter marplatensis]|uniref:fimbrial protein n=1 Tax=Achromobacter marplatensis TaxID=470868 RepID=UPI0039F6E119
MKENRKIPSLQIAGPLLQVLTLAFLFACAPSAWADTCSGGGQAYTISMPASVSVPRDAQIGTELTGWFYSASVTNIWSCSTIGQIGVGAGFKGDNAIVAGITVGGRPVHTTSLPGVGIAFDITEYTPGCGAIFGNEQLNPYNGWAWGACNPTGGGSSGLKVGAKLVKIGVIQSGALTAGRVGQGAAYEENLGRIPATGGQLVVYSITNVRFDVLSCLTPNVLVNLGTHQAREFSGIGSVTANATAFNIALNACPAGMNLVTYQIDPSTSVLNASKAVVALGGASTATGIGVQLLDASGNVFPLSTPRTLSGYSASAGGSYTVALKARYYQTGSAVGAGSANTAMTFTMTYQ